MDPFAQDHHALESVDNWNINHNVYSTQDHSHDTGLIHTFSGHFGGSKGNLPFMLDHQSASYLSSGLKRGYSSLTENGDSMHAGLMADAGMKRDDSSLLISTSLLYMQPVDADTYPTPMTPSSNTPKLNKKKNRSRTKSKSKLDSDTELVVQQPFVDTRYPAAQVLTTQTFLTSANGAVIQHIPVPDPYSPHENMYAHAQPPSFVASSPSEHFAVSLAHFVAEMSSAPYIAQASAELVDVNTSRRNSNSLEQDELEKHTAAPNPVLVNQLAFAIANPTPQPSVIAKTIQMQPPRSVGIPTKVPTEDPNVDSLTLKRLRNKVSASRCRQKKRVWAQELDKVMLGLTSMHPDIERYLKALEDEKAQLMTLIKSLPLKGHKLK